MGEDDFNAATTVPPERATMTTPPSPIKQPVDLNNPTPAQLSEIPCANPRWVKAPEGMQDDTKPKGTTPKDTKAQVITPATSGSSPCGGA